MSEQTFSSRGSYRTNITALGVRPGVLTADRGRLSFVGQDGQVFFNAAFQELHSVGLAEMDQTLEIWQGDTRHRISLADGGPLVGNLLGVVETDTVAKRWHAYLAPLVGPPPAGVTVHKPVSRGLHMTLAVIFSVLFALIVLVAVFALG